MDRPSQQAVLGCLLGTAVGDAIGLPLERLTPQRARKLFGEISPDYSMYLCLGRGLVSDDAEHAVITLQAYIDAKGNSDEFRRQLARRLKTWFLAFPPGIGAATVKACLKLLIGTSPQRSGVYSAGNGPAMRAPILGAVVENKEQLRAFVATSTCITHTDPKAEYGSLAVAYAAHCASTRQEIAPRDFLTGFQYLLQAEAEAQSAQELFQLLERVVESVRKGQTTSEFAVELGLPYGVSGYIYHTVPACLHAWLSHQNDYAKAVVAILQCGGDADSTAAIVGGIVGARVGKEGIPSQWRNAISEWPRSMQWMENVALQAAQSQSVKTPFWFFPVTLMRNAFLLIIVLLHAVRRTLPPTNTCWFIMIGLVVVTAALKSQTIHNHASAQNTPLVFRRADSDDYPDSHLAAFLGPGHRAGAGYLFCPDAYHRRIRVEKAGHQFRAGKYPHGSDPGFFLPRTQYGASGTIHRGTKRLGV